MNYWKNVHVCQGSNLKMFIIGKTIAFPCISTGVYGYPFREACVIALGTVDDFLQANEGVEQVYMVCFGDEDFARFEAIMKELM